MDAVMGVLGVEVCVLVGWVFEPVGMEVEGDGDDVCVLEGVGVGDAEGKKGEPDSVGMADAVGDAVYAVDCEVVWKGVWDAERETGRVDVSVARIVASEMVKDVEYVVVADIVVESHAEVVADGNDVAESVEEVVAEDVGCEVCVCVAVAVAVHPWTRWVTLAAQGNPPDWERVHNVLLT